VKQKRDSKNKQPPRQFKKSKARKTKKRNTLISGSKQSNSSFIDQSLRKIILELFDGVLPIDVIEKLKAKIDNPSSIRSMESLAHVFTPTQASGISPEIVKPDFTNYREPVPAIPDSDEEESLDDPMEIDFVRKREPTTSIATIKCKIKRLKISAMVLDSGAEPAIVSEDIVKRIGGKIDNSEKYDLSGIATVPTESIGVVRNLPITFPPGFTICEDFVVVRHHKPTLIFPNPFLKKYKCAVDWGKNELKIPFDGKDHIIPVTMHKVKNKLEVNCATLVQDKVLSSIQDMSIKKKH